MDKRRLRQLLEAVGAGEVSPDKAVAELETLPFAELGYARVDHHRPLRLGLPEVILGEGKTAEQILGIVNELRQAKENVLVTRLQPEKASVVAVSVPELVYDAQCQVATLVMSPPKVRELAHPVAVVTAGTSDLPVAGEALETLRMAGIPTQAVFDSGVAGVHRLLGSLELLRDAPAVIVIAGMEGALPSVVGGLVGGPIIAVPTSVGYGTALSGFAALFGMLSSCASGVTVVNIDNGFGAAMAVVRMLNAFGGVGEGSLK